MAPRATRINRQLKLEESVAMLGRMALLGDLMTNELVSVAPEDTIGEAAQQMADQNVGSAVVLDHGRLIGIVTERDLLRAMAGRVHPSEGRVREWMTADPVVASRSTTSGEAARLMLEHGFRHVPVVDGERTLGIVSLRDVVRGELAAEP
jgi:CBS domain-containing protein